MGIDVVDLLRSNAGIVESLLHGGDRGHWVGAGYDHVVSIAR
jgi:hypothetical protein